MSNPANTKEQWQSWMAQAQAGDKAAYSQLLQALAVWLKRYYARRVAAASIEDLVQEAMIAIHEKRHTYNPTMPLMPWLAAIAHYKWVDHVRKVTKRSEVELLDAVLPDLAALQQDADAARDVEKLLAQLPAREAKVVRLAKLEEKTMEEIAQATGHSESHVKVMIHRSMKKLMELASKEDAA